MKKLEAISLEQDDSAGNADKPKKTVEMLEANLTEDETRILNTIRARQMLQSEDTMNIDNLSADIIEGRRINLEHGSLGLAEATSADKKSERTDMLALIIGDDKMSPADRKPDAIKPAEQTEVSAY